MTNRTVVLGIGNTLLKDDGVGIRVIEALQKKQEILSVELVDAGTAVLDTLKYFVDYDRVIIVDSLQGGHPSGTIYLLRPHELGEFKSNRTSTHDVQILDVITLVEKLGKKPEVYIVGIEPKEIDISLKLSPEIEAVIPKVISVVKEILC